jgi:hypothetical protein
MTTPDTSTPSSEAGPTPERHDLLGLSFTELTALLTSWGERPFRARQIAGWVYESLISDFDAMTNLPASLRERLRAEASIDGPRVRTELLSKDGRTRKLLLELRDGRLIETVLMLYPATSESRARATVCVSTGQAACDTFCATGEWASTAASPQARSSRRWSIAPATSIHVRGSRRMGSASGAPAPRLHGNGRADAQLCEHAQGVRILNMLEG